MGSLRQLALLCLLLPAAAAAQVELAFRDAVWVMGADYTLGDVAIVQAADAALASLYTLEEQLDAAASVTRQEDADGDLPSLAQFKQIELSNVAFTYEDVEGDAGFSVGPINLAIARGDVVFLTGGNGSGKTTLMKLITGLFEPESGLLRIDDTAVVDGNRQAYRELFNGDADRNNSYETD